jgi:hypothetical protein
MVSFAQFWPFTGSIDQIKNKLNAKGTGSLGKQYVILHNEEFTFSPTQESETFTIRAITKGGAPNQVTTLLFQINSDGTVTFERTQDCHGSGT